MPDTHKHAADFLPCYLCFGFYARDTLYKHLGGCSCRPETAVSGQGASGKGLSMISHMLPTSNLGPELSTLLKNMRETTENPGKHLLFEPNNQKIYKICVC